MEIAFTRLHLTEHQEEEELPSFVYTEEFISAWYSHWAAVGEKLIWDSWYLKYCNYINPEFDMLGYQQKAYVADSSDEDEDEDRRRNWKTDNEKGSKNSIRTNSTLSENKTIKIPKLTSPTPNENKIITTCKRTSSTSSTPIEHKESNQGQGRKRIIYNEEEEENRSEIDQWSTAWNKHCDEEYNKEYNNFYLAYQPLDVAVTELVGGNAYGKTRPNKRQRLDRNCPAEILENPSLTKVSELNVKYL